jgi:nicotinate-nucleotide adenylyltransferase
MKTKNKRTGLFFGSFNPIHVGHLIIANHMLEFGGLDEVWFVVSPHNPLKKQSGLLEDHHRLAMVNVAIEDNPRFRSSNVEFSLPRPSYTLTTLTVLTEKYPGKQFVLLVGADSLESFHKWRNYETILKDYHLLVYPRPGSDGGSFRDHPSVTWVNAPLMQISSTFIRESIHKNKSVKYLLPEKVYAYMSEMHFYKKS